MCLTMKRDMHSVPVFLLLPAALGFLLAVIFLRRISKWRRSSKVPPGSMSLPLIGETIPLLKPCSVTSLGDFMEQRMTRYGKIFSSNFMVRPTIISADAELNRFVLKNEWRLFTASKLLSRDGVLGKSSIGLVDADTHKRMRSSVVEFFSGEKIRTLFLEDADRLSSLVVNSWREGPTIYAYQEAVKFALYITVKNISSITPDDVRMGILKTEYDKFILGLTCLPIYVPGTVYWKALQSREKLLSIFKRERESRLEKGYTSGEGRTEEADDFLTWLMKKPDHTVDQIGDLMLGVLLAGYDTTSKAISSLIYFLQGCPKAITQLRDEHLRIATTKKERGDGKLTWDDYKDMEFTKCVVNETLRITNVAAFITRSAIKDVEFKGYVIPKGWNVILHLTAVHLDPANYDDPGQFNPWRWENSTGTRNTNTLMPFGGGVRLCPGLELARLEIAVFLHHLILKYDWELVEPDPPMRTPFTKFHKGLPIRVRAAANCTEPFLE